MKRKILLIAFFLMPLMFVNNYAGVNETNIGVIGYLTGIWKLDQLYVNKVKYDSSLVQDVRFAFDLPNNSAYILRGTSGIQYSMSITAADTLSINLYDPQVYKPLSVSNPAAMFSYKVLSLTGTNLIIIGKAKDTKYANIWHDTEYRFIKDDSWTGK